MNLTQAKTMAEGLMREYLDSTWKLEFDGGKRRFGVCKYGERVIGLSRHLVRLNTPERVEQTILHEIAHAMAGVTAGHGPAWKRQARAIGYTGDRCYTDENTVLVKGNWEGTCPGCGATTERMRLTDKAKRGACASCCRGRFNPDYLWQWKRVR